MITLISKVLEPLVSNILIISSNPEYRFLGYPVYPDLLPDCGPAGGIYTGLFHSPTEKNLVLACDTPNLNTDFLQYLLLESERSLITVPVSADGIHPLCGFYSRTVLSEWKKKLQAGDRKMTEFLAHFNAKKMNLTQQVRFDAGFLLKNMNSREDLPEN